MKNFSINCCHKQNGKKKFFWLTKLTLTKIYRLKKSDFGLKDYHEASVVNFMRFSKAQRGLSLRSIQAAFKDIENSRLKNETTLTVDEVHDILDELWEAAKDEIETELSHQTHTYILLLRQLFVQAENWHLKLQADISELENK